MMDNRSFSNSNPWVTEEHPTIRALSNVLRLAERTGHLETSRDDDTTKLMKMMHDKSPSLRLIRQLRDITEKQKTLDRVSLEIQCRLMDKETRDITHLDVLESKIAYLNDLNGHLQSVVQHKDRLINSLQQPFVGDYLKVEATYHRHVKELFPLVASSLGELTANLSNMDWASGFDLQDGKLDNILGDISTGLAQLQTHFHSICQLRNMLEQC